MSTITANVARLTELVNTAAAEDAAKVEEARVEYAAAVAKLEDLNQDALTFVGEHLAEAFSTGSSKVKDTDGVGVTVSKHNRNVSIEVYLPESITLTRNGGLPFNPDGEGVTDEDIARATGTKTPEFHARTLQVLAVIDPKTVDIDTEQFGYYL